MTQYHTLFTVTLTSYYAIAISFALMLTDGWFTYYAMDFVLLLLIS